MLMTCLTMIAGGRDLLNAYCGEFFLPRRLNEPLHCTDYGGGTRRRTDCSHCTSLCHRAFGRLAVFIAVANCFPLLITVLEGVLPVTASTVVISIYN